MTENSDNQEFVVLNWDDVVELDKEMYQSLNLSGNGFKYLYMINSQLISAIIRRVSISDNYIKN
ncbi:MAG: hypothetical protein F6K54_13540 [Okeania sp. SIO3B5]|uniref:hypothetical protein n=1 Tax=Okeania sp. SIO3B5 TaxID=2607811 RepID=UPI0013FFD734|nr:hypothetical protein [Okeania sp. SIO3B5]NEO54008.1 hypothetical protein [Okeania sp. SIO3B5]